MKNRLTFSTRHLLGLLVILLLACSPEKETPEAISASFVKAAESGVEERKPRALRELVSENYADRQGRTRQDILAIANAYILRNKSIYLFSRLSTATLQEKDMVTATVLVALAGRPISDLSSLPSLNADMYWFDITLTRQDGDWLLTDAAWRQAMLEDFIGKE